MEMQLNRYPVVSMEHRGEHRRQRIIFKRKCGLRETVWNFIRVQLRNLPRAGEARLKCSHCPSIQTLQLVSHVFTLQFQRERFHFAKKKEKKEINWREKGRKLGGEQNLSFYLVLQLNTYLPVLFQFSKIWRGLGEMSESRRIIRNVDLQCTVFFENCYSSDTGD